jgi:hypothetical protein
VPFSLQASAATDAARPVADAQEVRRPDAIGDIAAAAARKRERQAEEDRHRFVARATWRGRIRRACRALQVDRSTYEKGGRQSLAPTKTAAVRSNAMFRLPHRPLSPRASTRHRIIEFKTGFRPFFDSPSLRRLLARSGRKECHDTAAQELTDGRRQRVYYREVTTESTPALIRITVT